MAPAVVLGAALIGAAVLLTVAALADAPGVSTRQVRANLRRGIAPQASSTPIPAADSSAIGALAVRLLPTPMRRRLLTLHARAGRPTSWTLEKMATVKIGLPLILGMLTLLLLTSSSHPLLLLVAVVAIVIGHFVPELLLYSQGIERREAITLELADTLDQMLISVNAGLGFDAAMDRAGRNGTGPLAEELVRTLQDMQMGHSRRDAYEALARRTDVPDLRRFVRSVLQADKNGVGISGVLRTQADEMRLKRRQRAEQKAMQIPVKVIFPLMLFILPVLFIVIMGPVVLNMMDSWTL